MIKSSILPLILFILIASSFSSPNDEKRIIVNGIYFNYGSSEINKESEMELNRLCEILNESKDSKVKLVAYVDSIEFGKFGKPLANQRIKNTMNFLKSKGIVNSRLIKTKYENIYLQPNSSDEGRFLNRFVRFELIK